MIDCLEKLAPLYEMIVFTAGMQDYADNILDYIIKLPNYDELVSGARETLGKQGIELPAKAALESYRPGTIGWMRKMIDIVQ